VECSKLIQPKEFQPIRPYNIPIFMDLLEEKKIRLVLQ